MEKQLKTISVEEQRAMGIRRTNYTPSIPDQPAQTTALARVPRAEVMPQTPVHFEVTPTATSGSRLITHSLKTLTIALTYFTKTSCRACHSCSMLLATRKPTVKKRVKSFHSSRGASFQENQRVLKMSPMFVQPTSFSRATKERL